MVPPVDARLSGGMDAKTQADRTLRAAHHRKPRLREKHILPPAVARRAVALLH